MNINPVAISFWIFGASLGFAIYGAQGAAVGLAFTSGISTLWAFWQ